MEWIKLDANPLVSHTWQSAPLRGPGDGPCRNHKTRPGTISLRCRQRTRSPEVGTMSLMRCLRRPAGAAHTRSPHRLREEPVPHGGQDYCRHHIIRAEVTAGAIQPYETRRNVAKADINWVSATKTPAPNSIASILAIPKLIRYQETRSSHPVASIQLDRWRSSFTAPKSLGDERESAALPG